MKNINEVIQALEERKTLRFKVSSSESYKITLNSSDKYIIIHFEDGKNRIIQQHDHIKEFWVAINKICCIHEWEEMRCS